MAAQTVTTEDGATYLVDVDAPSLTHSEGASSLDELLVDGVVLVSLECAVGAPLVANLSHGLRWRTLAPVASVKPVANAPAAQ